MRWSVTPEHTSMVLHNVMKLKQLFLDLTQALIRFDTKGPGRLFASSHNRLSPGGLSCDYQIDTPTTPCCHYSFASLVIQSSTKIELHKIKVTLKTLRCACADNSLHILQCTDIVCRHPPHTHRLTL